ncbi:hypothetical protein ACFFRR_011688 [Megaselia abdita]
MSMGKRCILCRQLFSEQDKRREVSKAMVQSSKKTVRAILNHLNKCGKKIVHIPDAAQICNECYVKIDRYDKVMVILMKSQKELSDMLTRQTTEINSKKSVLNNTKLFNEIVVGPISSARADKEFESSMSIEILDEEDVFNDGGGGMEPDNDHDSIEEMDNAKEDDWDMNDDSGEEEEKLKTEKNNSKFVIKRCEHADCTRVFYSMRSYFIHKKKHETATYKCSECGVCCKDEEYLELHKNIHEGKTELECKFCPKKFARRSNTIRHMQLHWDKKNYQCEKCGERFSQSNILYNHMLLHEGEEKVLQCEVCNLICKSRKTLRNHLNTHKEDRPRYPCEICGKTFAEKYTLKVHRKTHPDSIPEQPSTSSNEAAVEDKPTLRWDFQPVQSVTISPPAPAPPGKLANHTCLICCQVFTSKPKLNDHMQNSHDVILDSTGAAIEYSYTTEYV